MKTFYRIGREDGCDILLWDETNQVSRNHAQLRMDEKGGYWLTDTSTNGTYVNGIRQMANVEVPVQRGDAISFAHVEDLDWDLIEKKKFSWKWILIAISVVLVLFAIGLAISWFMSKSEDPAEDFENQIELSEHKSSVVDNPIETPVEEKTDEKLEKVQQSKVTKSDKKTENKTNDKKQEEVTPKPEEKTSEVKEEEDNMNELIF